MQGSTVNSVRLSYQLSGNDGPAVVLIHGLGGSAEVTYGPVIDRLSREFRVLAFDNRGVGGSDKPTGPYTLQQFARDTYDLMRTVGIEHAHVVGHSLGGMIALQFALDYPDATLSLVVADAPGELTEAGRTNFEQRATTVAAGGTAAIVEAVMRNGIGAQAKERYPELVEGFRQSLLASPAQPYAASCRAAAELNLLPRLVAYDRPALVLRGDQDGAVSREAAQQLAATFPKGRFEEIPDSGHNTPFENAAVFSNLVVDFFHQQAEAAQR